MEKEREELKELLKINGISENLIQKPAIFEKCFKDYIANGKKCLQIEVSGDDRFSFEKTKYILYANNIIEKEYTKENPLGNFSDISSTEVLNEYGLVKLQNITSDGYGPLDGGLSTSYSYRREKGLIIYDDGNQAYTRLDLGYIDINEGFKNGIDLSKTSDDKVTMSSVLDTFDKNVQTAIELYPHLKEYYENLRKDIIAVIKREYLENLDSCVIEVDNIDVLGVTREDYEAKISELTNQLNIANEKNKELVHSNTSLTSKLNRTLEFCEDVKNSPFGNIFFGRKIKKLNSIPDERE